MIDYHGNRAEWNLIRSVIVQVIIKFPKTFHTFWINTFGRDNVKKKKITLFWKSLQFSFFRRSGCCYGYCNQFCDWWIWRTGLSMIGCFNSPITGVRLQPTVGLHCPITIVQND